VEVASGFPALSYSPPKKKHHVSFSLDQATLWAAASEAAAACGGELPDLMAAS